MKILFAASECVPFCKTGGLADVIGALPKELRRRRHDVRIILPKYKSIRSQEFGLKETGEILQIPMGDRLEVGDLRTGKTDQGLRVYLVSNDNYFGRPGLYRGPEGDYPDNSERFIFFSRAVLEACKAMEFRPDIIHCHDWQTGLIPAYLKTIAQSDAFFQHTATVFTIHNIAFQGVFPKETMFVAGFGWREFTIDKLEFYDQMNFMKAGLAYSDMVTTVSPTYAEEIKSSPEMGWGLDGYLRGRANDFVGILNGLDTEEWDPAKDAFLARPFTVGSLEGRKECKRALQQSVGLPLAPRAPLLGLVARIDFQKGIDLVIDILPELVRRGAQVVVLGQGDSELLLRLRTFESQYPLNVRVRSDFNEPLAHHIYGGSDIFLMPSRFEPCGLGQLIAMRYGAIPVVHATGGLRDTVVQVKAPDVGNGFVFSEPTAPALLASTIEALQSYEDEPSWSQIMARGMQMNFGWESSASSYLDVYRRALKRPPVTSESNVL